MKVKELFQKHRKLFIAAIIGVVVVFGIFKFIASQPANVLSYISPKFEGYNGYGTVSYDSDQVTKKIEAVLLTKNGISQNDAEAIINDHVPTKFLTDIKEASKLADAKKQLDSVRISFDKDSKLSNGDTVKLTVDATKDLPIKGGTKAFKVSGLKKTESYTLKDVMGNYRPTFSGIDGYGELKSSKKAGAHLSVDPDKDLKNGGQVKVKLSSDYRYAQLNKGRVLSGPDHVNFKVSGLTPLSSMADWGKLKTLALGEAQSDNKSNAISRYDVKLTATYVGIRENYSPGISLDGSDPYKNVPSNAKYVSFITIVKIDETIGDSNQPATYQGYGYQNVPFYGGKLHTENLDQMKYLGFTKKTEQEVISEFKGRNSSSQELKL